MVFFTCNSCGQCVKKIHVEKHYLTECRNCEVLSCMDCGKDFFGDEYKHHTKCITENEKYGGKDYKANAKPNKGEVKQSQWIECVQAASYSQSLSPRLKGLLERLADYNNIPRKKVKFERFVQNSLKVYDSSLIEQIWTIFSEAGTKQKNPEAEKTSQNGSLEGASSKEESGNTKEDVKKKKKKDKYHGDEELLKKAKEVRGDQEPEGGVEKYDIGEERYCSTDAAVKLSKKRKHKKHDHQESTSLKYEKEVNGIADEIREVGNSDAGLSKKAKKNNYQERNSETWETGDVEVGKKVKKHRNKEEGCSKDTEMKRKNVDEGGNKKKKRKDKSEENSVSKLEYSPKVDDDSEKTSIDGLSDGETKKKKKKKHKDNVMLQDDTSVDGKKKHDGGRENGEDCPLVSNEKVKKRKQNGSKSDGLSAKKKKVKQIIEVEGELRTEGDAQKKKKKSRKEMKAIDG